MNRLYNERRGSFKVWLIRKKLVFNLKGLKLIDLTSRPTPFESYGTDFTELASIKWSYDWSSTRIPELSRYFNRQGKETFFGWSCRVGKDTLVSYLALNLSKDKYLQGYGIIVLLVFLSSLFEDIQEPLEVFNRLTKTLKNF